MKTVKTLIICKPFPFFKYEFKNNFHFCFVTEEKDHLSNYYEDAFEEIWYEKSLPLKDLPKKAKAIQDFVLTQTSQKPNLLFTPCNDTHCNLLEPFEDEQKYDFKYAVPHPDSKNERAIESLENKKIKPIIVKYNQEKSEEIEEFAPDLALCANDWCTEFSTIKKIIKSIGNIPYLAIQEGPQDWHTPIDGQNVKKYLNADYLFSQGPVTIRYIQPKFFSISGIPKTDGMELIPLPKKPKIFINLNFTYNNWEVDRDDWLRDTIEVCKELNLDYLISQHPRDNGIVDDPNLITSSAYKVADQLKNCSLSISRFSTIPLESLKLGRHSIYYNPHGESPKSYNEDTTTGIRKAYNKEELKILLINHIEDYRFNKEKAEESLTYQAGIQDGKSAKRVKDTLTQIHSNTFEIEKIKSLLA